MSDGAGSAATDIVGRLAAPSLIIDCPLCRDGSGPIDSFAGNDPLASLHRPLRLSPNVVVVVSAISLTEPVTRPAMTGDRRQVSATPGALLALPVLRVVDLGRRHAAETVHVRGATGLRLPGAATIAAARLAGASGPVGNDRRWRGKPLGIPYRHLGDIPALP